MKRSPQTPDLREAACPSCGKLLCRLRLEGLSLVELKCRHCGRMALDNGVARSRTLAYLAQVALKALEVGELEGRLASLETAVRGNKGEPRTLFDASPTGEEQFLGEEER